MSTFPHTQNNEQDAPNNHFSGKAMSQVLPKEKEVENEILEWLAYNKIPAWKVQTVGIYDPTRKRFRKPNNRYHINGQCDISGILPGGIRLEIEVKRPCKRMRTEEALMNLASDDQQKFINMINNSGGLAFVADRLSVVTEKINHFFIMRNR